MTRRDLAVRSFWSDRPLVQLYIERTGQTTFSLRQLIAFAEGLPDHLFTLCLSKTMWGPPSQGEPRARAPTRRPSQQAR